LGGEVQVNGDAGEAKANGPNESLHGGGCGGYEAWREAHLCYCLAPTDMQMVPEDQ